MRFQFIMICLLLLASLNQTQTKEPVLIVTEDLPPLQIVKHRQLGDGLADHKVTRMVDIAKLKATWWWRPEHGFTISRCPDPTYYYFQ